MLEPYAAVVARTGTPHQGQQRARTHNGFAVHLAEAVADRLDALQRLREVNRKIDPDNVFHQNFPVT